MRVPSNRPWQYILTCLLISWQVSLFAEFSKEQLEWLESDAEHPAFEVNEGDLEFLPRPADRVEHAQTMQITLTGESIESGWAVVDQCHRNLDSVPSLEIVFHRQRVRALQVVSFRNMRHAEAAGHRVLVSDIRPDSEICLSAESKILHPVAGQRGQQIFRMVNGPFMRRFLDGYYPISLQLQVSYPQAMLEIRDVQPGSQPGWDIRYDAGRIHMNGRFEGRLKTTLLFARIN